MVYLVDKKFHDWTHGLDTRDSMVSIFAHIRDIPYSLIVPLQDPKTSMEQLLIAGKGSCGPKHYLLAEMYRKLNLSVVFATIAFSWNDPDLQYPPDIRKQAVRLPVAYHLSCRVQIGCRWILVDATWDRPLGRAGFPVNDHWDGYSETRCAVKPLKSALRAAFCHKSKNDRCSINGEAELYPIDDEKDHWDGEDQARYYREKVSARTPDESEQIMRFNHDFDAWLDDVRQQKYNLSPYDLK